MCVITTQMLITCTGPKPNAPNAAHRSALRTPQLSVPHSSAAVLCAQQSSDICSCAHPQMCLYWLLSELGQCDGGTRLGAVGPLGLSRAHS